MEKIKRLILFRKETQKISKNNEGIDVEAIMISERIHFK